MGFLLTVTLLSLLLFAIDYYVYRNWRRFARYGRALAISLPFYRVLLFVMPLTLPLFIYFTRWWEVEPKLARGLLIGFWAFWYLPKIAIAGVLLLKDLARFSTWLFAWFRTKLHPARDRKAAQQAPLDLSDMKQMSRTEFLRKMGWSAAGVPFVIVGYGLFRTLYNFQVYAVEVKIPGLPAQFEGLRIAQLSDLHAGSFFSSRPVEEAIALLNDLKADLVVLTGDFVNNNVDEAPIILPSLARINADLGVYACLGNHDHYARADEMSKLVRSTGVDLLVNEHRTIRVDGGRLHVIGTDNTGLRQNFADLPKAVSGMDRSDHGEDLRVLLAHDPTFWDSHVRPDFPDIQLTLSGHTHGGQIGFEKGPMRWGLSQMVYPRWAGLYEERAVDGSGPQQLYINRGLGTVGPPIRLGIPPEITLLTLTRG